MNPKIKISEEDLPKVLKKFNNKSIYIYFSRKIRGRITFNKAKIKVKSFEIDIFDLLTDDVLNIELQNVFDIKKTKDNRRIYLFSNEFGEIEIER